MNSYPKINRLISLPWAELATRFRFAVIAGNMFLSAKLKQAIEHKKEIRNRRRNGIKA